MTSSNGHYLDGALTPKARQVLALMLTRPNDLVPSYVLAEELWGQSPPKSGPATLQTYVYHIRQMIKRLENNVSISLTTVRDSYRLNIDSNHIDAASFQRGLAAGQRALSEGNAEQAEASLTAALGFWRGAALCDVQNGTILQTEAQYLEDLRVRAYELRLQAYEAQGHTRELVANLRRLINAYPLNETFHLHLMRALCQSGRRAEAIYVYETLRRRLDADLGVFPMDELQITHLGILNSGSLTELPSGPDRISSSLLAHPGRVAPN